MHYFISHDTTRLEYKISLMEFQNHHSTEETFSWTKSRPFRFLLWVVVLGVLLAACSTGKILHVQAPKVDLISIRLGQITIIKQKLIAQLRAFNPNGFDLPVSALHCSVTIEESLLASGTTTKPLVLPAHGEVEFELEVTLTGLQLAKEMRHLIKAHGKAISYRLSGKAQVNLPFVGELKFNKEGKFIAPL